MQAVKQTVSVIYGMAEDEEQWDGVRETDHPSGTFLLIQQQTHCQGRLYYSSNDTKYDGFYGTVSSYGGFPSSHLKHYSLSKVLKG